MRTTIVALIALGACTRADGSDRGPEPEPAKPAVSPAPPVGDEVALQELAKRLETVTAVSAANCMLQTSTSSAGLRAEYSIPLAKVEWTWHERWGMDQRPAVVATCTKAHGECIAARSESRTLDIPHHYSWHHNDVSSAPVFVAAGVTDRATLVAALNVAKRFCAKTP